MTIDRSLHRFFLTDTPIHPNTSVDLSPLAHQLSSVLRMKPGDQILLLDGSGSAFTTRIDTLDRKRASGTVLSQHQLHGHDTPISLTLYQCSLKADKFEWVLQKGTELGASAFVPVISARSVVRPAAALRKKYDRWHAILREAAEQCGRATLPTLHEPLNLPDALLHAPAQNLRLLPWEETADQATRMGLGPAVAKAASSTATGSTAAGSTPVPPAISLLLGPEGGLTADEVRQAQDTGWQVVSLGPRILRAETAALASLTIVLDRLNALQ